MGIFGILWVFIIRVNIKEYVYFDPSLSLKLSQKENIYEIFKRSLPDKL